MSASQIAIEDKENDMIKAGIAVDDWKLPIFERHLTQAGYAYEKREGLVPGTCLLAVSTENPTALAETVRKASDEAHKTGDVK